MIKVHLFSIVVETIPKGTLTFSGTQLWVRPLSTRRQDITYTYRHINKYYLDDDFFKSTQLRPTNDRLFFSF
jgi:hypothetical protein